MCEWWWVEHGFVWLAVVLLWLGFLDESVLFVVLVWFGGIFSLGDIACYAFNDLVELGKFDMSGCYCAVGI